MRRIREILLPVLAALLVVLSYASTEGWLLASGRGPDARAASFHGGKRTSSGEEAAPCVSPACHGSSPHRRTVRASAFLNMHVTVVSCLGCHGADRERRWRPAGKEGIGGSLLAYSQVPVPGTGDRRHEANGPPASCRSCHSVEGRRAIAAAGVKGIHEGFEDPISLRMIEEGGRKWLPDGMR